MIYSIVFSITFVGGKELLLTSLMFKTLNLVVNDNSIWFQRKIKRFVLTSPLSISCGQWNMVHFSDESKLNLFGSDRKRFVRRKNGERLSPQCVKKTVKSGREV